MSAGDLMFKALCISLCVICALGTSEEMTRDFIDHLSRIPNPDRVLNSVLNRLQRKQELESRQQMPEEDYENPPQILPEYTESLKESNERGLRQIHIEKHHPICAFERNIRRLNTKEYEYRPAYYEEIKCTSVNNEERGLTKQICDIAGFSCVQWNKTVHLTRRRYSSDCWETRTIEVMAGCECMWPVSRLGDISLHV